MGVLWVKRMEVGDRARLTSAALDSVRPPHMAEALRGAVLAVSAAEEGLPYLRQVRRYTLVGRLNTGAMACIGRFSASDLELVR